MANAASNDKSKRYDRQIRIWGAHGQERLESARVCLLNSSSTGSELLKNLVLGGIHSFTIVDEAQVSIASSLLSCQFSCIPFCQVIATRFRTIYLIWHPSKGDGA